MDVVGLYTVFQQVVGHFLGHTLGQCGDEYSFSSFATCMDLVHKVVNLVLAGSYLNLRVEQSRRAYHLFHHHSFGFSQLVVGRGGADIDDLIHLLLEFFKAQRTVVEGCRQTETVLYKVLFSTTVTAVHAVYLWNGDMTFVDKEKIVVGKEVEQTIRSLTGLTTVEVTAVVLYARAVTQFLDHLHVVLHTFLYTLCFYRVALFLKESNLLHEIVLDVVNGYSGLLL